MLTVQSFIPLALGLAGVIWYLGIDLGSAAAAERDAELARQQQSPRGTDPLEHGLAVHVQSDRLRRRTD